MKQEKPVHSLIPIADFKALLGVDEREDALCRYCLVTASYTIERYCRRRLITGRHTEYLAFTGDRLFTLREYPVRKVLAVYTGNKERGINSKEQGAGSREQVERSKGGNLFGPENRVDPAQYYCLPEEGTDEDIPFSLVLRLPHRRSREETGIRIRYEAGYKAGEAPPDVGSACLELAAWTMSRYKGRRIGLTGAVRGAGKDGEHLESSMPENVRLLLEPYRRRCI